MVFQVNYNLYIFFCKNTLLISSMLPLILSFRASVVVSLAKADLSNCPRENSPASLNHKNEAVIWHRKIGKLHDHEISHVSIVLFGRLCGSRMSILGKWPYKIAYHCFWKSLITGKSCSKFEWKCSQHNHCVYECSVPRLF